MLIAWFQALHRTGISLVCLSETLKICYFVKQINCNLFVIVSLIRSQAMLANLSSTPPFASLLRKEDDSKPGSLPSDSNLKNSPALLQRRVSNHILPSQRTGTANDTRFYYLSCVDHFTPSVPLETCRILLYLFDCHDHSTSLLPSVRPTPSDK